jgi:hypothetical protein
VPPQCRRLIEKAAHALSVLDSYTYGLATADAAHAVLQRMPPGEYPHLTELTIEKVPDRGYYYCAEYGFGRDLMLDGLEQARVASRALRGGEGAQSGR